jgi:hypothetical protein
MCLLGVMLAGTLILASPGTEALPPREFAELVDDVDFSNTRPETRTYLMDENSDSVRSITLERKLLLELLFPPNIHSDSREGNSNSLSRNELIYDETDRRLPNRAEVVTRLFPARKRHAMGRRRRATNSSSIRICCRGDIFCLIIMPAECTVVHPDGWRYVWAN